MKPHNQEIQKSILTRLLSAPALRYAQMRPEKVPNDLFNYHLQFLVKKGLVEKEKSIYRLSPAGKKYIAETSPLSPLGRNVEKFKVHVLTLALKSKGGAIWYVSQRRTRHPFFGIECVPGGTKRRGETVMEAASRKLREETGLSARFTLRGIVHKSIYLPDGELFSDVFFYICIATRCEGELLSKTPFGENTWMRLRSPGWYKKNTTIPIKKLGSIFAELYSGDEGPLFFEEEKGVVDEY